MDFYKYFLFSIVFWSIFPNAYGQEAELIIPTGQTSWIQSYGFSPDGKYFLSSAYDRSIKIWDVKEKKEVFTFWKHEGYVTSLTVIDDEKVISADINGYIFIWELHSGKILKSILRDNASPVSNILYYPENNSFLTSNRRGEIDEYSLDTGKLILGEVYHSFPITKFQVVDNGRKFFTVAPDESLSDDSLSNFLLTNFNTREIEVNFHLTTARFISAAMSSKADQIYYLTEDPAELRILNHTNWNSPHKISLGNIKPIEIEVLPDGNIIIASKNTNNLLQFTLFNVAQSKIEYEFSTPLEIEESFKLDVTNVPYDEEKILINSSQHKLILYDYRNKVLDKFMPDDSWTQLISAEEDALYLNANQSLIKFNLRNSTSEVLNTFSGKIWPVLDAEEKIFMVEDRTIYSFDKNSGITKEIYKADHWIASLEYNKASNKLLIYNYNKDISIFDFERNDLEYRTTLEKEINFASWFGNEIVYSSKDFNTIYFLDWVKNTERQLKIINTRPILDIENVEGNILISSAGEIKLFDQISGELINSKKVRKEGIAYILKYDLFLKKIICSFEDGDILLLHPSSLNIEKTFKGHTGFVSDLSFTPDYSKLISSSSYNSIKIWDSKTTQPETTLVFLKDGNWTAIEENGLFDASLQAMKEIYYVVNDSLDKEEPWKIIELEQLKHRYYQPGLMQMQLGYNEEPMRTPPPLTHIPLAPKIIANVENDQLILEVKNQGGGIGNISVYINNSEIISDARPNPASMQEMENLNLKVDLSPFSNRLLNSENLIKVIAWNKENWLKSRPVITKLENLGVRGAIAKNQKTQERVEKPKFYALIAGTSDYSGEAIDLNYAAKDARDFSHALKMAAVNLFGDENVKVELLTTDFEDKNQRPTKENILQRFSSLEKIIKPSDLLVVYLSGHGVNYGGPEGDFYYLTAEASSADATYMADEAVRNMVTLSSDELTELFNSTSAGKKVLILDACAAGRATEKMFLTRDVPSSQIRALDRMQDRTGFYVLAGSAADAVSYESSVYGQGLLTYSLLKAMKGAALRKDGNEEYVDIQGLFQYAVDEVPVLSKEIGGIQKPFFKTPDNMQSYDIGKVDLNTKEEIVLSEPKPMFLEATLSDANLMYDALGLTNIMNGFMENLAAEGKGSKLAFTRAKEYPGAYKISGTYSQTEDAIQLNYVIITNNKPVGDVRTSIFPKDGNFETSLKTFFENISI